MPSDMNNWEERNLKQYCNEYDLFNFRQIFRQLFCLIILYYLEDIQKELLFGFDSLAFGLCRYGMQAVWI